MLPAITSSMPMSPITNSRPGGTVASPTPGGTAASPTPGGTTVMGTGVGVGGGLVSGLSRLRTLLVETTAASLPEPWPSV